MTNRSDLFWQLFDALGYVAGEDVSEGAEEYGLLTTSGLFYPTRSPIDGLCSLIDWYVPYWPTDTLAAFELVRDVLDKLNAHFKAGDIQAWKFEMSSGHVRYHRTEYSTGVTYHHHTVKGRDAEALSRLAMAAMTDD